jgi:methylmalonyl-CoA/ethylmalonyl-CoA epimerase
MSREGEEPLKLAQISVNVHDLGRATAFYRDVLKLPFLFEAPRLAFFDAGGVRLMLSPPERPEFDHPGSILYYRVPDITKAYEELESRGVRFDGTPHVAHRDARHELWLVSFRDSEGNTLVLMTEKAI